MSTDLYIFIKQEFGKMCRVGNSGDVQTAPCVEKHEHKVVAMRSDNGNADEWGIDKLSKPMQFALLGSGVFFFFGIHNILQEAMMKVPGFNFGVMLGYMEVIG